MGEPADDEAAVCPARGSCPADRAAAIRELERLCGEAEGVRDRLVRQRDAVAAELAARGRPAAGASAEPGAAADGGGM